MRRVYLNYVGVEEKYKSTCPYRLGQYLRVITEYRVSKLR
jgi:hypothetical protein